MNLNDRGFPQCLPRQSCYVVRTEALNISVQNRALADILLDNVNQVMQSVKALRC